MNLKKRLSIQLLVIFGLILFPFGASANSISEQGIVVDWPLEEMYIISLILVILSLFLLCFNNRKITTIISAKSKYINESCIVR